MNAAAQFLPLVLLIVIMYFLLIRPQKKREKSVNEMRNSIKVGDEVITIGGICGKIVKTKDDSLVIQVGADKIKFEIMRWAISKVVDTKAEAKKEKPVVEEEEAPKKSLPKRIKKKEDEDSFVIPEKAEETVADKVTEEIEN